MLDTLARTLLYIDGSPFARMVRVLAREWQVPVSESELEFPLPESHFQIAPLGQVPVLIEEGEAIFPTALIIDRLAQISGRDPGDRQVLMTLLAWGDTLVSAFYQEWAGLVEGKANDLGFDPAARHLERTGPLLDWVAPRLNSQDPGVPEIALACLLFWTDSRRPIPWRGRPVIDDLTTKLNQRQSFVETAPRPLK